MQPPDSPVSDAELITLFEGGADPPGGFHHREHVRVAWYYLLHHSMPEALVRFSDALRRFALAHGKPNLYHETITTAFLLLVTLFLILCGYYVCKTVREPLILTGGGAEAKAYASAFQALLLMACVPAYSWLA